MRINKENNYFIYLFVTSFKILLLPVLHDPSSTLNCYCNNQHHPSTGVNKKALIEISIFYFNTVTGAFLQENVSEPEEAVFFNIINVHTEDIICKSNNSQLRAHRSY